MGVDVAQPNPRQRALIVEQAAKRFSTPTFQQLSIER